MTTIDLHTHSTASDGSLTPTQLVQRAREIGLQAIAITDHDSIDGLEEGRAEAGKVGIEFINGVELSLHEGNGPVHLLGFLFDIPNSALESYLETMRNRRAERNIKMIARFKDLGIEITETELCEQIGGRSMDHAGRPHFARILVTRRLASSFDDAFDSYLGKGKKAFVPKHPVSASEGIQCIHDAGGIAVIAHPKYAGTKRPENLEALVKKLADAGLDGLECYYSGHTTEETRRYIEIAGQYNLAISGGTDFHGEAKPDIALGSGLGDMKIPYNLIAGLREAHKRRFG